MLTPAAAAAMTEARSEVGAPEECGIRFFARTDGASGITFDFVMTPEPDDVLGGSSTMRTYVEAGVHQEIGDATVDYDDGDGTAELVIRPHRATNAR